MKKIAILYQAHPVPAQDGVTKPMKKGGYSDSGADIAFVLKNHYPVISPKDNAKEDIDLDWVFPDTDAGIKKAREQGAEIFWLNTVLYATHPIKNYTDKGIEVVGQDPDTVETFDNKWTTNQLLSQHNIPIPKGTLIQKDRMNLKDLPFVYPMVLKPIRGRGSQGVELIQNLSQLKSGLEEMFDTGLYGTKVYVESFLTGDEITITVMPPGNYFLQGKTINFNTHWALPPVLRFNHELGIAPYSGKIAVVKNSRILSSSEIAKKSIQQSITHCIKAAALLHVKAPVRIDCRADSNGMFHLFDLNLKPNMTGNIRKGRTDQNSLSSMAAASYGWSYDDFIRNILNQKWFL